uniref:Meiosis 1 associated protein n=1 Tax=Xenopus tropicalis TaxID=8364 RepID=A0A6I8R581_XENTR
MWDLGRFPFSIFTMKSAKEMRRGDGVSFSPVPPCILVVDVAPPGWGAVRTTLCEALSNALNLCAATAPACTLLGIYSVRERHHCVFPLQPVRNSFARLHYCISELRSAQEDGPYNPHTGVLALAVLDALQQNRQLAQHSVSQGAPQRSSVEVAIVSAREGKEVASQLDSGLRDADLGSLHRLLVVLLSDGLMGAHSMDTSPQSAADSGSSAYDIEFQVTSRDVLSLESFFKSWLFNKVPEKEKLNLILHDGEAAALRVICDVQRRLLNPECLHRQGEQGSAHIGEQSKVRGGRGPQMLKALRAIPSHGICASLLYGFPSILTPTASWELDWDTLESNEENFRALCHYLQSQELSLLACTTQHSRPPSLGVPVQSHFIVSSSDSVALLLRPVAVREIVLPIEPALPQQPVKDSTLLKIQDALQPLQVDSVYNPLSVTCGLYRHLQTPMSGPPTARGDTSHFIQLKGASGIQIRQAPLRHRKARATVTPLPLVHSALALQPSHSCPQPLSKGNK